MIEWKVNLIIFSSIVFFIKKIYNIFKFFSILFSIFNDKIKFLKKIKKNIFKIMFFLFHLVFSFIFFL